MPIRSFPFAAGLPVSTGLDFLRRPPHWTGKTKEHRIFRYDNGSQNLTYATSSGFHDFRSAGWVVLPVLHRIAKKNALGRSICDSLRMRLPSVATTDCKTVERRVFRWNSGLLKSDHTRPFRYGNGLLVPCPGTPLPAMLRIATSSLRTPPIRTGLQPLRPMLAGGVRFIEAALFPLNRGLFKHVREPGRFRIRLRIV